MSDDALPRSDRIPAIVHSEADYRRAMERLADIAEGKGEQAMRGEFSHLMQSAERWEACEALKRKKASPSRNWRRLARVRLC